MSTTENNDEIIWLTTQEASRRLGVTPRTLYRFIDEGDIPAYKMGRVFRVQKADVDAFIARAAIKPGALSHLIAERRIASATAVDET